MLRKRDLGGPITVDGEEFAWELRREPQWCTADGWQGMLIGVGPIKDGREALLQFAMREGAAQRARGYRHRPQVQRSELEQAIRKAIALIWEPDTKGKSFHVDL